MNSNQIEKNELKILIIGDSGTGKTSFGEKWTKDIFSEFYKPTIVSEFSQKIYEHKGIIYKIHLWDLAGQDKNISITKIFSKDAHGVIVLCDVLNENSLEE
jgi:Ras-related protein Rab-7A